MTPFFGVQNDALEKVSRSFREYSSSQGPLPLLVGVLLIFLVAAAIVATILANRDRMVGRRLFLDLSRASGLDRVEVRLLMQVARRFQPDNPPAIFVRRSLFESAVDGLEAEAGVIDSVRKKVYGP